MKRLKPSKCFHEYLYHFIFVQPHVWFCLINLVPNNDCVGVTVERLFLQWVTKSCFLDKECSKWISIFLVTESFPLKYMFQAVSIMHIGKITFLEFTYDDQFPNYKLICLNLYIGIINPFLRPWPPYIQIQMENIYHLFFDHSITIRRPKSIQTVSDHLLHVLIGRNVK